jgi:hypothetical protein
MFNLIGTICFYVGVFVAGMYFGEPVWDFITSILPSKS